MLRARNRVTCALDSVHQGDRDGEKGGYHINAVGTATQWQAIGCAAKISESLLLPVLEAMLHQFPFRLQGFPAGNGSEYNQSHCRQAAGKTADRVHQIARQSEPGHRAGGRQKRSGDREIDRLRPHSPPARRNRAEVLCGASESVAETFTGRADLRPAVWRRAASLNGATRPAIMLRKTQVAATGGAVLADQPGVGATGPPAA